MKDPKTLYRGRRWSCACDVIVEEPGQPPRKLDLHLDLRNHSPTGFEWGYGGSGPSQLALALVADATGDGQHALESYRGPIFAWVKKQSARGGWELTAAEIFAFAPVPTCAGGSPL